MELTESTKYIVQGMNVSPVNYYCPYSRIPSLWTSYRLVTSFLTSFSSVSTNTINLIDFMYSSPCALQHVRNIYIYSFSSSFIHIKNSLCNVPYITILPWASLQIYCISFAPGPRRITSFWHHPNSGASTTWLLPVSPGVSPVLSRS